MQDDAEWLMLEHSSCEVLHLKKERKKEQNTYVGSESSLVRLLVSPALF